MLRTAIPSSRVVIIVVVHSSRNTRSLFFKNSDSRENVSPLVPTTIMVLPPLGDITSQFHNTEESIILYPANNSCMEQLDTEGMPVFRTSKFQTKSDDKASGE